MTTPPTSAPEQHASLEHLLLRFGLITLDQLSTALREQTEVGTPFTEVLVRDGLISPEDLARVADRAPAPAPAPAAAPEPEPEPELPPAAQAEPEAEQPTLVVEQPVDVPEPPLYAPVSSQPVPEPQRRHEPVYQPVAAAPEPEPEPIAAAPAPAYVPAAPAVAVGYLVRGRLVNGEEIEIATVADAAEAQRIARDAMRACARPNGDDWPVLNGRYVRPESIVSIEVAERF
jgi:outer membrane biosynthesis protein TonB